MCITMAPLVLLTNNLLSDPNFCNVISPLGNSDHNGIHMECNWKSTASST